MLTHPLRPLSRKIHTVAAPLVVTIATLLAGTLFAFYPTNAKLPSDSSGSTTHEKIIRDASVFG